MLGAVSDSGAVVERAIVFEQVVDYRRVSAHRCVTAWSVLFEDELLEADLGLRMVGPVVFVALRFRAAAFTPEVAARFSALVEKGGGTELALGELSTLERASFLARLEQCVHRRLRLSPEQVGPAWDALFAGVDRAAAQAREPERRATERYPVTAAATVTVGDAPPVEAAVQNLSLGGAFLSAVTSAPVMAPVSLELHLPAGPVKAEGTIVNLSDRGLGIQFAAQPQVARKLVENLNAIAPAPAPPAAPLAVEALLSPAREASEPDVAQRERLGDYELLSLLGRGGRGDVFFARGLVGAQRDRLVAIKRLNKRYAKSPAAERELVLEGRTLALLDHPAVVKTIEAGAFDGHQCLVMELLDGRDLGQLLRRARARNTRLPLDVALFGGRRLLEALAAVHGAKGPGEDALQLVHCDVSPHNLFVSRAGEVKLGDFGSVRRSGERVRDVLAAGRPSYLSPEGLDGVISAARDLWAAAVTIFQLVTLQLPFTGDTLEELTRHIRSGAPRSLRLLRAEAPAGLQRVLERALHREPGERFGSATEFAQALSGQFDAEKGSEAALAEAMRALFSERR
jgi:hypothetical protein